MTRDELAGIASRSRGRGPTIRCPAHDDRSASLSVSLGEGGRILLFCHAGCSFEAICSAFGLDRRDVTRNDETSSAETLAATYDYRDEKRNLLYEVLRYVPKRFRQRRPDGSGGWIWNLNETRRLLFRFPELLSALSAKPERRVFIVEGEKDVDRLRSLGFLATTNAGGAGKWRDEYSDFLRDRHIIILPDNDSAGRKHADQVAFSLCGKAASVKILSLSNLPLKGDASDWLDAGGTPETFKRLAIEAPAWVPSDGMSPAEPKATGFTLTSAATLIGEPEEAVRWLVDGMLPHGGISAFVAKPKVGKSTLARQLAVSVARGEPFFGRETSRGPVIYLALEEKRGEVRSHFKAMGVSDEEVHVHFGTAPENANAELRKLTEQMKPVLIIVDPLFRMTRVKDVNAYAEVTAAIEPLVSIARETGAHLLAVHHGGKTERSGGDSILGSTAIFGSVDTALMLKRGERYRTVWTIQRYGSDLEETVLDFDEETRTASLGKEKEEVEKERVVQEVCKLLDDLRLTKGPAESLTEPEILADVEGKTGIKRKALRELLEKEVERLGSGRRGDPFRYRRVTNQAPAQAKGASPENARSLVPNISRERENENPKRGENPLQHWPDSRSREITPGERAEYPEATPGNEDFGLTHADRRVL